MRAWDLDWSHVTRGADAHRAAVRERLDARRGTRTPFRAPSEAELAESVREVVRRMGRAELLLLRDVVLPPLRWEAASRQAEDAPVEPARWREHERFVDLLRTCKGLEPLYAPVVDDVGVRWFARLAEHGSALLEAR